MLIVADNLQITSNAIAGAIRAYHSPPIVELVQRCEAAGAEALDINTGPLTKAASERMQFCVETVQRVSRLPLLLDTVNATAIEAGLQVSRNRTIINGFSLEPRRVADILPLAKKYDAEVIGYLLNAQGRVPATAQERLATAVDLYQVYCRAGLNPDRLIIDPVVPPLMWADGRRQALAVLETIRQLPLLLDYPVQTIAGLSNLTTGSRLEERTDAVANAYLAMLASAGLSMAMVNVLRPGTVATARAGRALTRTGVFTWEGV